MVRYDKKREKNEGEALTFLAIEVF